MSQCHENIFISLEFESENSFEIFVDEMVDVYFCGRSAVILKETLIDRELFLIFPKISLLIKLSKNENPIRLHNSKALHYTKCNTNIFFLLLIIKSQNIE